MMNVGVRELKQRLSEFLDRAARGERICVTDRGRPKVMLVPIRDEDTVAQGIQEGWITVGDGAAPAPVRRAKPARSTLAVLAADRDA